MTSLDKMLWLVRDKRIDYGVFVAGTRTEFRKFATYLTRRWVPPEWFDIEDVEQWLYLGAWMFVDRYDEKLSKGNSISRYVVYNAMSMAKTQLHKARGVTISGTPDKKVSQIEIPLTFFGEEGEGDQFLDALLAETPKIEEQMILEQERQTAVARALEVCTNPRERVVVLAIRDAGSLDAAGRLLYDDFDLRISLRLPSEKHADRFVQRQAGLIALRLEERAIPGWRQT